MKTAQNISAVVMVALCVAANQLGGHQHNMPAPTPPLLPVIAFHRPLVDLSTAQAALDRGQKEISALVRSGELRGFNVATEIYTKNFLRILAADIEAFQRGQKPACKDFQAVMKMIFPMIPEQRPGVVGKLNAITIASRLNVKTDHVFNLVSAGWLRLIAGSRARRGPFGSPDVELSTVAKFLRQRRIS